MSKYIDLAATIKRDRMRGQITGLDGESYALTWLDSHPDQVPGRTITESELHSALRDYNAALYTEIDTANRLGLLVTPDPEPTNAEKLEAALRTLDRGALGYSLNKLARDLDKAGVKAPTHD